MRIVYLFIISMLPVLSGAQSFEPMLQEGRCWYYYQCIGAQQYNHFYAYYVDGDTLMGGYQCKRIYKRNMGEEPIFMYGMYEDGGKVYCVRYQPYNDSYISTLLYDYSLTEGEEFKSDGTWKVENTQQKNGATGMPHKILTLANSMGNKATWVSGIGGTKCIDNPLGNLNGDYGVWLFCGKNGDLEFTVDDFGLSGNSTYIGNMRPSSHTYEPMLVDGRVWHYWNRFGDTSDIDERFYSYFIKGDTLLGGIQCKKVYKQQYYKKAEFSFAMYEEKGRVYEMRYTPLSDSFSLVLLYDFTLETGDEWNDGGKTWTVTSTGWFYNPYLSAPQKCIKLTDRQGHDVFWVSGVGGMHEINNPLDANGDYGVWLFCEQDKTVVFTAWDFGTTGIGDDSESLTPVSTPLQREASFYDLQGHRLSSPPAKGVYIRDGKKVVK